MENQTISNNARPNSQDIIKVLDKKNIFISVLSIIIGGAIFATTFTIQDKDSMLPLILMTVGCIIALYGIFRCLGKAYKNVYQLTGSSIKEYTLYFEEKHLKALQDGINTLDFSSEVKPLKDNNATVRLDILMSDDQQFAQLQLMKYENYVFHTATDIYCFHSPEVVKVIELMNRH